MVLLLVLALLGGAHSAASRTHLSIADQTPFTVRGSAFRPQERVKVVVHARNTITKTVVAGARGGFVARMPAVKLGSCPALFVRATGNQGSRASLKIISECANLAPPGP